MQVYCDSVNDLLNNSMPLKLEEDEEGHVILDGLREVCCTTVHLCLQLVLHLWHCEQPSPVLLHVRTVPTPDS